MPSNARLETVSAQHVAGLITRASYDDPSSIGGLWQTFASRSGELAVQGAPLGVYHDYASDYRGAYSLLLGLPVEADATVPSGWTAFQIPAATYMVFRVPEGEMPGVLVETWQAIWAYFDKPGDYERAYTVDYEQHGDPTDIYIAVRPR
jgi:predicted transcriptional regulator YdeE